ncbi:hypothetical protein Acsp06_64120 [Actinomycetospora sp. NBRC 106375]|uniref:hypothetical protein n=1 Tax=Actinomycetospora sp. NBRC 106375 TaxID=3032207 RepID=UPI0024A2DA7E|nr:hypothetical protein [Actinomycetospora sp. NBRC 106375]GLZ50227.1 hypothetical protein Acsp06_64120 [Actinomycetospora sp. NBRC 106375]
MRARAPWWRLATRAGGAARPALAGTAMVAIAELSGQHEILFPEGIALAAGIWVAARPDWTVRPRAVLVVPTVCAALGIVIGRLPGPRWLLALAALGAAFAVLVASRSRLTPALSAAVLPIWFGTGQWGYILGVVGLTGLLALTVPARSAPGTVPGAAPGPVTAWPAGATAVAAGCAAVWLVAVGVLGLPVAAAAPPLLVAGVEFALAGAPRRLGVRRWCLLSLAGAVGCGAGALVGPAWGAAALALGVVTVLMLVGRTPLPPALAIALVPLVLDRPEPVPTTAMIALGAAVVHLLPALLVRLPGVTTTNR